ERHPPKAERHPPKAERHPPKAERHPSKAEWHPPEVEWQLTTLEKRPTAPEWLTNCALPGIQLPDLDCEVPAGVGEDGAGHAAPPLIGCGHGREACRSIPVSFGILSPMPGPEKSISHSKSQTRCGLPVSGLFRNRVLFFSREAPSLTGGEISVISSVPKKTVDVQN
ncbi:MAG: hypothetical protein V4726_03340, partial [Verrucomicrobiota bacterium]